LVTGDVTVQATAGFGTAFGPASIDTSGITVTAATSTRGPIINLDLADEGGNIGEAAMVRVKTLNTKITNPPTIGDYTLTVKTSADTTAVTSNTYTTTPPTILPLPGIVERYNSAGVLMEQQTVIATCITNASVGDVIRVGAGTYDENLTIGKSITLEGDAATTIIKDTNNDNTGGMVTISYQKTATTAGAVFDGFTVSGNRTPATAITITGVGVTVQNCTFTKAGAAAGPTATVAQTLVIVNPAVAATTYGNTITNCTFDTTLGAVADIGVDVQNGFGENTTISNCTFTLDETVAGTDDTAILIDDGAAGPPAKPVTVDDCTISGASGVGIAVSTVATGAIASIKDSTLSGLDQALVMGAAGPLTGTATVTGCTIDACGIAVSATLPTGQAAIGVTFATSLKITNSAITNGPNDIIEVADDSENIYIMFNDLSGNAKGIDNNDTDTTKTLNATHNWWGVATGPVAGFNVTAGAVNSTSGYLGAAATGTFATTTAALSGKTTAGVDVSIVTTAGVASAAGIVGAANYASNPGAATPYPALAGGFYDVYVGAPANTTDVVTILLYNSAVTAASEVYVMNPLTGEWTKCAPLAATAPPTQGVNTVAGYAYVTVAGTTTMPALSDLVGLAFAICEAPAVALTAPTIIAPESGDRDVSLRPTFAWAEVAGADAYYFELADNPNFVLPMMQLTGDLGRLIVPYYAYMTELDYSSAYYWRVKAVRGKEDPATDPVTGALLEEELAEGSWASGVFITEDEPEEPTPPVVVEEAPPVVIEPIVEVVTPPEEPITPAWIYAIIGVGAVLVIAVIVLIVRTRRVA
jgi:hypothetical protein